MPNVGLPEVVIVLAIVLLIFGPKRLPAAGRALGRSMREFKDSISGANKDDGELEPPAASDGAEAEVPRSGSQSEQRQSDGA